MEGMHRPLHHSVKARFLSIWSATAVALFKHVLAVHNS